jgi:hypothetical protein
MIWLKSVESMDNSPGGREKDFFGEGRCSNSVSLHNEAMRIPKLSESSQVQPLPVAEARHTSLSSCDSELSNANMKRQYRDNTQARKGHILAAGKVHSKTRVRS